MTAGLSRALQNTGVLLGVIEPEEHAAMMRELQRNSFGCCTHEVNRINGINGINGIVLDRAEASWPASIAAFFRGDRAEHGRRCHRLPRLLSQEPKRPAKSASR
ncbi:MAG: hypothetical protein ABI809_12060 [Caldimonas sp.]